MAEPTPQQSMSMDAQMLKALGELSGELRGISQQIQMSQQSTNQRIDDLKESVKEQTQALNQRIDDHQKDVDNRLDDMNQQILKFSKSTGPTKKQLLANGGAGGAGGSLAIAIAELIKYLGQ